MYQREQGPNTVSHIKNKLNFARTSTDTEFCREKEFCIPNCGHGFHTHGPLKVLNQYFPYYDEVYPFLLDIIFN